MHPGQYTSHSSPPSLDVPRFDDDIRLQRWFVANTSHNCLRLSYTNKQIDVLMQETFDIA